MLIKKIIVTLYVMNILIEVRVKVFLAKLIKAHYNGLG